MHACRWPPHCCSPIAPAAPATASGTTNYSPKMVADDEPVPKGGGTFKIGNPYTINGRTYYPSHDPTYRAEGIASWYGRDFHGRMTANGEVYDMNAISAAHPTMPMPSYARVTNLENGRSIVVRVNDRGPYAQDRIIDLSIGTAKALGTLGQGLGARAGRVCRPCRARGQRRPRCWQPCAMALPRRPRRPCGWRHAPRSQASQRDPEATPLPAGTALRAWRRRAVRAPVARRSSAAPRAPERHAGSDLGRSGLYGLACDHGERPPSTGALGLMSGRGPLLTLSKRRHTARHCLPQFGLAKQERAAARAPRPNCRNRRHTFHMIGRCTRQPRRAWTLTPWIGAALSRASRFPLRFRLGPGPARAVKANSRPPRRPRS